MDENKSLPATLPADAKGLTRRLSVHFNYGRDGGAAVYSIHAADGTELPIMYQYDTRKKPGGETGFFIQGVEQCFKQFADLAAYWPEYVKAPAEAAA